jgi:hypothetical protein
VHYDKTRAKLARASDLLHRALEVMEASGAAPADVKANVRAALTQLDAGLGDRSRLAGAGVSPPHARGPLFWNF